MRCNYNCTGCYSRGRPTDDELSTNELDKLFDEAEELGVGTIVVTGGEPLLHDDILDLMIRHRRLLFEPVTNGSLMTPEIAQRVAQTSNIIMLVSIEGFENDTDERRRSGAYVAAIRALEHLRDAGACFGFAATNTAANAEHLATDAFLDQMITLGCSVGFFTEYVPCGSNPRLDWCLNEAKRADFHRRILGLRRRKPILLIQFPHDEYDEENRCSAAGDVSLHINSQGGIEPCPFVPIARENIRQGGLLTACRSTFLRSIREHPSLLRRDKYACALFEHRLEVEAIAIRNRISTLDEGNYPGENA